MKTTTFSRRAFIQQGFALAAAPLAFACTRTGLLAAALASPAAPAAPRSRRSSAKVAVVSCRSYVPEVRPALEKCFDNLRGLPIDQARHPYG